MTRLLASVTSVEEAMLALDRGADIIDLKNPQAGALGALPVATIERVVAAVGGRRPVSATIGDVPMQPELIVGRILQTAATGVDIVKIGFFGTQGHDACIDAVAPLAGRGVRIVAVLFADAQPDFSIVSLLAKAGFHGVMLDTAQKNGKRLTDWLSTGALRTFIELAQQQHLLTGLAGSLALRDVETLAPLRPDYLGFRGALCADSERTSGIDPARMGEVADMLHKYNISVLEMA